MKDETGKTYGKLRVLEPATGGRWLVECACGTRFTVKGNDLRRGRTVMCQACFKGQKA